MARETFSKMTISTLKSIEREIIEKNPNLKQELYLYKCQDNIIKKKVKEKEVLDNKINNILNVAVERRKVIYNNSNIISKLFMNENLPELTDSERYEIKRLHNILWDKYPNGFDCNKYNHAFTQKERLDKVRKQIEIKERKKSKRDKERAIIASFNKNGRKLGAHVKNELKVQIDIYPYCPYCGVKLNNKPHCDHIYPLSKGGLSMPDNMIYVCSECNLKKGDLTLNKFISKYSLDREVVERNLLLLSKDY